MESNVYVGARYVPKFANPVEWNSINAYEPLTIVTYQGASYTSKTYVPVGVAITNTDYWVVTGNYNAQVELYRQQIVGVQNQINGIEDFHYKKFNRKWLFLGDSYDGTSGWVAKLVDMMGLEEGEYWNLCVGGDGFYNNLWISRVQTWVANHPEEVGNIGHILIAGGFNDSRAEVYVQLANLIQQFGNYCYNTFDDATVQLAYIGWGIDTGTFDTSLVTGQYRCGARWLYSQCGRFHMEYLNGCETAVKMRDLMNDDGFHPNVEGGYRIAVALLNAIKTGHGGVNFPLNNAQFSLIGPGIIDGAVQQSVSGLSVYTRVYLTMVEMYQTFVGNVPVAVANLKLPHSSKFPRTEIVLNLETVEGNAQTERFALHVDKDILYMTLMSVENNTWKTVNVKNFWLFEFNTVHDTLMD